MAAPLESALFMLAGTAVRAIHQSTSFELLTQIAIIDPLLEGTKKKLLEAGVKESNIVVQTVPGSWELPIAVQRCV